MRKYKILAVLPAKNEEKYIGYALRSLERQSLKPDVLLLVDDGSTDRTPSIMREFRKRNGWAYYLRFKGVSLRNVGARVAQLLLLATRNNFINEILPDWEILIKFDADTIYEERYVEKIVRAFYLDNHLGVTSGVTVNEPVNKDTARGSGIAVRRSAWDKIDLKPILGWDSYIVFKAKALGWRVYSLPDAKMYLLRLTSSSEKGLSFGKFKQGFASGILGYPPLIAVARATRISLIYKNPLLFPSYLAGYIKAITEDKEFVEKKVKDYIRAYQNMRLLYFITKIFK